MPSSSGKLLGFNLKKQDMFKNNNEYHHFNLGHLRSTAARPKFNGAVHLVTEEDENIEP